MSARCPRITGEDQEMSDGTIDALARQAVAEWYELDPNGADGETLVRAIVLKLIEVKAAERLRCELIVSRMFAGCRKARSPVAMLKAIHDGEET